MSRFHDDDLLDEDLPDMDTQVAPGGWRRAAVGFVVGLVAGVAVAALLPRPEDDVTG